MNIIEKIEDFFYRLKRVIVYIPIIWKGVDFDYYSAIDIFKFQLDRLANVLEKDTYHENSKTDAQKVRTAIKLLDRVYNDYYSMEYLDIMEKKYGEVKLGYSDKGITVSYGNKKLTKKEEQRIKEEERELFVKSLEKQKKAERILWEFIHHNIGNWWV